MGIIGVLEEQALNQAILDGQRIRVLEEIIKELKEMYREKVRDYNEVVRELITGDQGGK